MLPKEKRLPRAGFQALARTGGERAALPYFTLKIAGNTAGHNRFGVVVGSAVCKGAVRRNFLKRRIRGALARWPEAGADALVVARIPADHDTAGALACLARIGREIARGRER